MLDKITTNEIDDEFYDGGGAGSFKGHLKGRQLKESKKSKARYHKLKRGSKDLAKAKESFIIAAEKLEGAQYGIVSGLIRGKIKVLFEGKNYNCTIDQGLPFDLYESLAIGDYVTIKASKDKYFVDHMIERKTVLARPKIDSTKKSSKSFISEQVMAANADVAVIVVAAKNPSINPRFIDRCLVLVRYGGITPIICVNKVDLGIENEEVLSTYRNMGIQVIETSVETGIGIDELKDAIRNKAVVLIGNSGVGKSSLINTLSSDLSLRVGEVASKTGKGKHTTTASNLIIWDEGSLIIDTPGIRTLGVMDISKEDLHLYYPEILKFSHECKYTRCTHNLEEGCNVKDAVKNGLINMGQYESYLKILGEI